MLASMENALLWLWLVEFILVSAILAVATGVVLWRERGTRGTAAKPSFIPADAARPQHAALAVPRSPAGAERGGQGRVLAYQDP